MVALSVMLTVVIVPGKRGRDTTGRPLKCGNRGALSPNPKGDSDFSDEDALFVVDEDLSSASLSLLKKKVRTC